MAITNKFYIIENNELDSFTEEEKEIAEVVYLESPYFSRFEHEEAVRKMFKDLEEKNPKRLDYQNEELLKFGTIYKVIKEDYDGTLTIKRVYTWATLEYKIHAAKLKES